MQFPVEVSVAAGTSFTVAEHQQFDFSIESTLLVVVHEYRCVWSINVTDATIDANHRGSRWESDHIAGRRNALHNRSRLIYGSSEYDAGSYVQLRLGIHAHKWTKRVRSGRRYNECGVPCHFGLLQKWCYPLSAYGFGARATRGLWLLIDSVRCKDYTLSEFA